MKGELFTPSRKEITLYTRNSAEKVPFVNDECEFIPCGWTKIENELFPLGYKIVDTNLRSLEPNKLTYQICEWLKIPDAEVKANRDDSGGVWTALRRGSIKTLEYYMLDRYGVKTRTFLTAMFRPVYANSYRIKSQGVMLLEEIFN